VSLPEVKKDISEKLRKNYTDEEFEKILERRRKEFGFE